MTTSGGGVCIPFYGAAVGVALFEATLGAFANWAQDLKSRR